MRVAFLMALALGCKGEPTEVAPEVCTEGFADRDGDGWGDPRLATTDCVEPVVANDNDCDDSDFLISPDAEELCDNIDNDCDTLVDFADSDVTSAGVYYVDGDGDGFGAGEGTPSCEAILGSALADGDCDDADPDINPDAIEVCDSGVDNNCNELADTDDPTLDSQLAFFVDLDGDGFGSTDIVVACDQPIGTAMVDGDCDDNDAATFPGAIEICDNLDQDCDGDPDFPQFSPDVCATFEGPYEGSYTVTLIDGPVTRTCTGTLDLTLDRSQATPIEGTLECTLDAAAEDWALTQTGTLTGSFKADGSLFGELTAFEGASYAWTGTASAGATVEGGGDGLFVTTVPWDIDYSFDLTYSPF